MLSPWAWALIEPYLMRNLINRGVARPSKREMLEEFGRVWGDFSVTIMVQEPWMSTIRFKRLAHLNAQEMEPFLDSPERWIAERFGGGKFKVNFHHGLNFVSTKNFKPEARPRWQDLPELPQE